MLAPVISSLDEIYGMKITKFSTITDETLTSFSTTPTAYMAQANFSLAVAGYTKSGYNWPHSGNFKFLPRTSPNSQIEEKLFNFFFEPPRVIWRNLRVFLVEIQKSPWWRQLYPPEL